MNELSGQTNILAQESYFIRIICYLGIGTYDFVQVWNLQHKKHNEDKGGHLEYPHLLFKNHTYR